MKLPRITIEPNGLTAHQIAKLSGEIIKILSDELKPYIVVHRTIVGKNIIVEAKPSGIKA